VRWMLVVAQAELARAVARAEEFSAWLGSARDLFLSARKFPYVGSKIGKILGFPLFWDKITFLFCT
jgi:hypothetical protein